MIKDLLQSRLIISMIRLCAISWCLLFIQTITNAGQLTDVTVEFAGLSSGDRFILAASQEADNRPTSGNMEKSAQDQTWSPPPPPPDEFDWIQLTSGEWLKGELKVLYEKELEFDSDKLGLQKFDWEDVKQVRGHQRFSVLLEGSVNVTGFMQVKDNKVFVIVGDDKREFERNKLIAIAPGKPKEINYWSAKIRLGLNVSKGNTDQLQYNTKGNIWRRTSASRFVLDYLGNFTTTDSVDTVDNQRINIFFDIFRTRKYFLRPIFGEYYRDPFQNIEYRTTLGAGIGYHIIDTSKISWDVTAGPAYQFTQFKSFEQGENSSESTPALVAGTNFDTELTKTLDLIGRYNFNIVNKESGRYTHHAIVTLETEITDLIDFDISMVWDRTQKPSPKSDGKVPKQDDFQTIVGVGVDF